MNDVVVEADAPGLTPRDAYEAVARFERYPDLTNAVRSVDIGGLGPGGGVLSTWEVNFRNGILRWSEEDWFDASNRTIRFTMTEGDFEHYAGAWIVETSDGGARLRYVAQFDLGIPSLSHIIDPIAARALYDNIIQIMHGLLPCELRVRSSAPSD